MGIRNTLYDRRTSFIQRWHARQTVRSETLAEHNAFVTRDAELVARALHHYGIAEPVIFDVMMMAMIHDEPEKVVGDVSGEAKRDYPALKKILGSIEQKAIDEIIFDELPGPMGDHYRDLARRVTRTVDGDEKDDLEAQIVRYADKVEALLFSQTEVDIGNTLMQDVVDGVLVELGKFDWPWLQALRHETDIP